MDNFRGSTVSHQGTNTNHSNPSGKNRNRKKKNKQQNHNNQQNNQNIPLSPSKNLINHYTDYGGSMSLDYNTYNRPFNKYPNNNQNYNYNNQNNNQNNNRNRYNNNNGNGKYVKRRNGSQSNYYGYENDRLNKSLTPNNSFGENTKIQTSISLDNFDIVASLNQKRSPISNSYSFMSSNVIIGQKPTSPYKTGAYPQQQTIIEQVNLEEEVSEATTNSLSLQEVKSTDLIMSSITSTESLNTSGDFTVDDTPVSCYSTPFNHQSDSSRLVDPDMSPKKHRENENSLNQDKTPVKYDESEHTVKNNEVMSENSSAVMSDSSPDSKNSDQNLVTASEGEASFGHENTVMHHHEHNLAKELEEIAHSFDLNVQKSIENESNKSANGSVQSSSTESFSTTSNDFEKHSDEERVEEQKTIEKETVQELVIEQEVNQEEQMVEFKPQEVKVEVYEEVKREERLLETVPEKEVEQEEVKQQEPVLIDEEVKVDVHEQKSEEKTEISIPTSYEIRIRPEIQEIDLVDEEPVVIENEVKIEENLNIENVDTKICEEKQDAKTENENVEALNQTIESIVSELNKTNSSITQKEPAVDCFSCTIV